MFSGKIKNKRFSVIHHHLPDRLRMLKNHFESLSPDQNEGISIPLSEPAFCI
jgi:hypothetical protein